jgi:hypothetical protein
MKKILSLFLILFLLTGCTVTLNRNTDNHSTVSYGDSSVLKNKKEDLVVKNKVEKIDKIDTLSDNKEERLCPIYIPSLFDIIPIVPIEAFSKIKKENSDEKVKILINYIEDLRKFIGNIKFISDRDYKLYLDKCRF